MHDYARALERLLASPTTPKLGLERMRELLCRLGDPHRQIARVLHVAGTKGKGSTCAFVDAILREAGLRVGLTTSPHLCTARERIVIDGEMVSPQHFAALEEQVAFVAAELEASFFERMIAMAWLAFAHARVDVVVLEVGLGGRLDATNVCAPSACAVTRLGLDHMEHLGPALADIAREKAGIFKRGVPAVSVPQEPEAHAVLVDMAARVGAPLAFIDSDAALRPSLAGAHQQENASAALALIRAAGLMVDVDVSARGLALARWPGRYETLAHAPLLIVDGAHNALAARALAATIAGDERVRRPVCLVVGMTQGRDAQAFAEELAGIGVARSFMVAPRSPRAHEAAALVQAMAASLADREACASVAEAVQAARTAAGASGTVIVCGSLYLVGEVRHQILGGPLDPSTPLY